MEPVREQILNLQHISYTYHTLQGETLALSDISFSLKKGEFAERLATNGGKGWTRLSYNGQTLYAVSSMLITAEEYNRSQNSAAKD